MCLISYQFYPNFLQQFHIKNYGISSIHYGDCCRRMKNHDNIFGRLFVIVHPRVFHREAFENILAFVVRRVSPTKPLWIEHEGKHVGKARWLT